MAQQRNFRHESAWVQFAANAPEPPEWYEPPGTGVDAPDRVVAPTDLSEEVRAKIKQEAFREHPGDGDQSCRDRSRYIARRCMEAAAPYNEAFAQWQRNEALHRATQWRIAFADAMVEAQRSGP